MTTGGKTNKLQWEKCKNGNTRDENKNSLVVDLRRAVRWWVSDQNRGNGRGLALGALMGFDRWMEVVGD